MLDLVADGCVQREQPLGTPGREASWDGSPVWTGGAFFEQVATIKVMSGLAVNFTAVQEWFVTRYAAWKADSTAGITVDDVVDFFGGDAAWTSARP